MIPQKSWERTAETFRHMTDQLGKGIDPGILDTVIALNVLGIETSASCEGHLDHGIAAPWIDLAASSAATASRQVAKLFTQARTEQERLALSQEEIDTLFAQAHQEQERVKRIHLAQRQRLLTLLARFYASHQAPYDVMLVIHPRDTIGRARLESQGADLQLAYPPEVRAKKLQDYQREMLAFTTFLRGQDEPGTLTDVHASV